MTAIALATATPALAQIGTARIVSDRTTIHGARRTNTSELICRSFTDRLVLSVSLTSVIIEKDTTILLNTNIASLHALTVPEHGRLLLKLRNDSIMRLVAARDASDLIGKLTEVNGRIFHTFGAQPSFIVGKEQISDIVKYGVGKIKIELIPEPYEKEFKKDKVGEAVSKLYNVLMDRIRVPKTFESDF